MPDANVIVIAPTEQNVKGSLRIINEITNHDYIKIHKKRSALIFPILSRLDTDDTVQQAKWLRRFREEFGDCIKNLIPSTFGTEGSSTKIFKPINPVNVEDYVSTCSAWAACQRR